MSTTQTPRPTRGTATRLARFAGYYLEMSGAAVIGMFLLGRLWPPEWTARVDVYTLTMATHMAIALALWMRIRGRSWPRIAEMCTAVYLPFLVLLVPYWLGVLSLTSLMAAGHLLMFLLMLAVMVWRRFEYWR